MLRKRLLSALLCLSMLGASGIAEAAKSVNELKNDLSKNQKIVEDTKKEINKKKKEQSAQMQKKNALEAEISGLQHDIDAVQAVIDEKDAEINAKNTEIAALTDELQKTDKKLKKRMKVIYESGSTSYLELILEADGISDLFTRLSVVESILKHDNAMMDQYQGQINTISEAKKLVESEKAEQVEARKILDSKQSAIESKKAENQKIINSLNSDINELKRQEAEAEKTEKQIQAAINAALKSEKQKQVVYKGNGKFTFPLTSYTRISSPYGYRIHPITGTRKLHTGIDYAAPHGTSILAAEDGVVLTSGWMGGYGYTVTVNHGGGYVTLYAHCSSLSVSAGQSVKKGQTIARVGSTGNSTGNHLHFEVKVNGKATNPASYL